MLKRLSHGFGPLYGHDSEILILGSFPSKKSREEGFFYGHPQNRFWAVVSTALMAKEPKTIEEKRSFVIDHHLALYDVIESCLIEGSSDDSIREVRPANLSSIVKAAPIKRILLNGQTAAKYFRLFQKIDSSIEVFVLPSTSSANASFTLEGLVEAWKKAIAG
jgi:double-stranded uracil-DNA glycosylase